MNWTIDQLKIFEMAAKEGSFSAAARKLGKAQSRVSTAISDLEVDLGADLFDRSQHTPRLTQFGQEMLQEARFVLAQKDRLNARALAAVSGQDIELVIAGDEAVPLVGFQTIFARLAERFPNVKLTLTHGSRNDIATAVVSGRATIGVLFRSSQLDDEIEFQSVGYFRQTLIVSKHHKILSHSAPNLSQLQGYRQLVICDRLGENRATPLTSDYWHIDSYYQISEMVAMGLGWALVPEHIAHSPWYRDSIRSLSTQNIPQSTIVEVGVIKRRDRPYGEAGFWLLKQLEGLFSNSWNV